MPGDRSGSGFDPRHDPRFQRGYDGGPGPSAPIATPPDVQKARRPARDSSLAAGRPDVRRSPAADAPGSQSPDVPTGDELDPGGEMDPGDEPEVWETRAYSADSSARRWLRALWWIGGLLVAFGVACLVYGIWANNDTAGQPYQDFWLSVFSSIAWGVYGAALMVGIMTLVATAVLQTLAPWLRRNR